MFQNSCCSSSLDLSTADYDPEFPVIKTEMGPKHRAAASYYHHYQAQSEVLPATMHNGASNEILKRFSS